MIKKACEQKKQSCQKHVELVGELSDLQNKEEKLLSKGEEGVRGKGLRVCGYPWVHRRRPSTRMKNLAFAGTYTRVGFVFKKGGELMIGWNKWIRGLGY
ncbi:hypothetical protein L1987_85997 [Smallanthus sonchifolius]|uniref:Uncharacterized protein n=1 Tax=Smallanthus sonchifolius TaxID=185202 RepID=A0ACB8XYR4_9ASTR|nr:hypothetical protein L1987_85997 [Smallanthus sonchifolius]